MMIAMNLADPVDGLIVTTAALTLMGVIVGAVWLWQWLSTDRHPAPPPRRFVVPTKIDRARPYAERYNTGGLIDRAESFPRFDPDGTMTPSRTPHRAMSYPEIDEHLLSRYRTPPHLIDPAFHGPDVVDPYTDWSDEWLRLYREAHIDLPEPKWRDD